MNADQPIHDPDRDQDNTPPEEEQHPQLDARPTPPIEPPEPTTTPNDEATGLRSKYVEKMDELTNGIRDKQLELLHQADRLTSSYPGQLMVQVRPFLMPALGVTSGPQAAPTPVPTKPALAPTESTVESEVLRAQLRKDHQLTLAASRARLWAEGQTAKRQGWACSYRGQAT